MARGVGNDEFASDIRRRECQADLPQHGAIKAVRPEEADMPVIERACQEQGAVFKARKALTGHDQFDASGFDETLARSAISDLVGKTERSAFGNLQYVRRRLEQQTGIDGCDALEHRRCLLQDGRGDDELRGKRLQQLEIRCKQQTNIDHRTRQNGIDDITGIPSRCRQGQDH